MSSTLRVDISKQIDLNISEFLDSDRGGNTVQSISIDEETEDGCMVIIRGFHLRALATH
jgi:hypothetical protein